MGEKGVSRDEKRYATVNVLRGRDGRKCKKI